VKVCSAGFCEYIRLQTNDRQEDRRTHPDPLWPQRRDQRTWQVAYTQSERYLARHGPAGAAALCSGQTITSAHSGTVYYFEGNVSIDSTPIQSKVGMFSDLKERSVLRTARGRAEVLLTPGVFLRVGENSAIKMLDNRLVSTRVEILSGTVIVESDDPQMSLRDSPVALLYKDFEVQLVKYGLVEISSNPAQIKVYRGEAVVDIASASTASKRARVRKGQLLPFSEMLLSQKFNDKIGDALYLWARGRAQSLSAANTSLDRSVDLNERGYGDRPVFTADR
jgi:hypothetical protein